MRVRLFPRLAGWGHYISHAEAMAVNGPATLVRTPDNEHDPNAIEVHYDGRHIGHVPREVAARVAPLIDAGHHFDASAEKEDGGSFKNQWGELVEWAHIEVMMTSDHLSDEVAMTLCDIPDVLAAYMVGNDFCAAHRTRREWAEAGRRLRPRVGPIGERKEERRWGGPIYESVYSVSDLTMPRGASQWPGWTK